MGTLPKKCDGCGTELAASLTHCPVCGRGDELRSLAALYVERTSRTPDPDPETAEALARETAELADELREAVHSPEPVRRIIVDPLRDAAFHASVAGSEAEAARILRDALRLPLPALADWRDVPIPAPILWRDPGPDPGGERLADAVLSAGEVGILAAEGGTGKSTVTLALALAAARAAQDGADYGAACGLRVRPGPTLVVGYEDSPTRQAHRLRWIAERTGAPEIPPEVRTWADPAPLFLANREAPGGADPGPEWSRLWEAVRALSPSLVVVDPVSLALEGATVSEAGPVRAFLAALRREAEAGGFGVLAVAHSTKAARTEARATGDPGPGAVAGSAAWYDAARGVLTLTRDPQDPERRILEAAKANHGRSGWGAALAPRETVGGRFAGFELAERLDPAALRTWKREAAAAVRSRAAGKRQSRDGGAAAPAGPDEVLDW